MLNRTIRTLVLTAAIGLIATLFVAHVSFQQRVIAVLSPPAAQSLGLAPGRAAPGPFEPGRYWIAKTAENGRWEYRAVWPIIGAVPFDIFGSGTIEFDLFAACERLGERACQIIRKES